MCLCDDHDLEWPGRPPGTPSPEALVLEDCALALFTFKLGIVFQEVAVVVFSSVLLHALKLNAGLLWQACGGPNLTVWMRVGAAHGRAFVFENLHVAVLVLRRIDKVAIRFRSCVMRLCEERRLRVQMSRVDLSPGVDDWQNVLGWHVGESEVVFGREGDYVALALC